MKRRRYTRRTKNKTERPAPHTTMGELDIQSKQTRTFRAAHHRETPGSPKTTQNFPRSTPPRDTWVCKANKTGLSAQQTTARYLCLQHQHIPNNRDVHTHQRDVSLTTKQTNQTSTPPRATSHTQLIPQPSTPTKKQYNDLSPKNTHPTQRNNK